MAKYIMQIIILGTRIFGRVLTQAVRQELKSAQKMSEAGGAGGQKRAQDNLKTGITLHEAQQILNVSKLDAEEIRQKYEHLFDANDKAKGGSFYLQSKVVRAKERLDMELELLQSEQTKKQSSSEQKK